MSAPPLLFLLGTTAVGKSELSLRLAEALDGEILSLDSMALFRRMDIGTAKPEAAHRARVPHHLLDLVEPWEEFDVSRYLEAARGAVDAVRARGRIPLFVGGTAFYFMALTQGLFDGPGADRELRRRLLEREETGGEGTLHRELARHDPEAARRIHPRDRKRVVRALEVFTLTGMPLSTWQTQWGGEEGPAWRAVGLRREPEPLRARVARRVEAMLAAGLVAETEAILAAGGFSRQSGQALGYAQVLEVLEGQRPAAELAERITLRTWRFVRKQRTWFRKLDQVRWCDPDTTQDPLGVLLASLT